MERFNIASTNNAFASIIRDKKKKAKKRRHDGENDACASITRGKKKKAKKSRRHDGEAPALASLAQPSQPLPPVDSTSSREGEGNSLAATGECDMRRRKRGEAHTLSIAVAGSIINNVQSLELATRMAGQIARAAAIFRVDEVIVFDDGVDSKAYFSRTSWAREIQENSGGHFLARILQYLEVPQYLRRTLFPMHPSFRFVGLLPPLDIPHHLRKHGWLPYREGVTLDKKAESGGGSYVDVGLEKDVLIRETKQPGLRITVAMGPSRDALSQNGTLLDAVPRKVPKEKGLYWGYTVRHANHLNAVFKECPFSGGYDYTIGTSEHGEKIKSSEFFIPKSRHILVAFGGLAGLEESKELDETINVGEVSSCFNRYINTCPYQGSRTIRTEEAILISLQYLHDPIIDAFAA